MEKRRYFGVLLCILGVLFLSFNSVFLSITGNAITEYPQFLGNVWFFAIGMLFLIIGVVLANATQRKDLVSVLSRYLSRRMEHEEAHNAKGYAELKERYGGQERRQKFIESHGVPPEDERAWITLYHAFPRQTESKLERGDFLDRRKAREGFYMSEKPQDAVEEVSQRHNVDPRDVSIAKIKIAKNVYNNLRLDNVNTSLGVAQRIAPKRYKLANSLIEKGLIIVE